MSVVHRLRGAAIAVAVAAAALVAGLVAVPPANAASCAVTWGSGPKVAAGMTSRQLTGVRAGRHTCYDRLVIDLNGAGRTSAGYHDSYVSNVVQDGSGQVVSLRGGAKLAVVVRAPAYDGNGRPTCTPANRRELVNVTGFQTFRQLAFAGSFEGQTTIGLGVRAWLPMRGLPAGWPWHWSAAGDRRRPPVVRV
jgi:hypothetical protein